MEFTGRLAAFPAASLLQWAAQERATGSIVVRRSQKEKSVAFRSGLVVGCRSSEPQELFGRYLLAYATVPANRLAQALIQTKVRKRPLGQVLVDLGILDEETARSAVERFVREGVQDLILWNKGVFYFEDVPPGPSPLSPALAAMDLALEGSRWQDEIERIRKVIVNDAVVLGRGPAAGSPGLSPFEQRLLASLAVERSVKEVHDEVGGVMFPILEGLFQLLQRRIVEIVRHSSQKDTASRELDLRDVLLSLQRTEEVLVGKDRAMLPLDAIEALVPIWVRVPSPKETESLSATHRAFLEGFDGRASLRRLLSGNSEERADQLELLFLELKRRNVVLLPAAIEDVERRIEEGSALRRLVKRLRT